MGWGFNTVSWGFSFQFVSGILFASLACYYWVKNASHNKFDSSLIFLSLILASLCGVNGLIASLVLGSGFSFISVYFKNYKKRNVISFFIWFLVCFINLIGVVKSAYSLNEGKINYTKIFSY
jgi:hypothetical protein